MMSNDYIRQPDKIIRDCLLPRESFIPYNDNIGEEEQIRKILSRSEMEYELHMAIIESELEEGRRRAREEREKHFAPLKTKLIQFHKLDKANKDLYQTLIEYITAYESGFMMRVEVNLEFYDNFLRILGNIRISPEEKKRILAFIVLE